VALPKISYLSLIVLLSLSCATTQEPVDDSCLSFSVLDTKVEGIVVYDLGPAPVLEVLPIGQADILSAEYRSTPIPESIPKDYYESGLTHSKQVVIHLSEAASATLMQASETHRLKKIRISRETFEPIEPGMMGGPKNDYIAISVTSEEGGLKLIAMLTTSCS